MFSSQGSGWILRKVNRLEIKIAAFAPVHASSYIALPDFLNGCRSLLNIRNHFDHNCFVYCFVAAYHIKNRINLLTEGRWGTEKTNPDTYKNAERQPVADYQMPMPINRIPYFEDANDVRVNVFGYTESYLVPIATAQPSPSTSYTVAIEKREPCGYAIAAIDHGKATPVYFELKRGDNCMNEFVKSLHVLARDIYN